MGVADLQIGFKVMGLDESPKGRMTRDGGVGQAPRSWGRRRSWIRKMRRGWK